MSPEPSPLDPASLPESYRPFAAALMQRPDPALELVRLLDTVSGKAPVAETFVFAERLLAAWPDHPIVLNAIEEVIGGLVQSYHLSMVADAPRNAGYARAIATAVGPGMTVLEIGTGSGLLAMLAARAGADHVFTVEARPVMAMIARRNIARNGLGDRITVIDGLSTDLRVGRELPRRAEVLIHELFDARLIGDKVIDIVAHARSELLAPEPVLLPSEGTLRGRVAGAELMKDEGDFGAVCGLDLSALEILRRHYSYFSRRADPDFLSEPAALGRFDFRTLEAGHRRRTEVPVTFTADGTATGVVQWIGYRFPDGTTFENAPPTRSHWQPLFYRFVRPMPVRNGETRRLLVTVADHRLGFALG